jgi:hypothetical protein
MVAKGVKFPMPPKEHNFGSLAQFLDSEGPACSVSQERDSFNLAKLAKRLYLRPLGKLPVKPKPR